MKYTLLEIKQALESYYACGYLDVLVDDFIRLYCNHYDLNAESEARRIRSMLGVLEKQNVITIDDGIIHLWNMLSPKLRLIINDN